MAKLTSILKLYGSLEGLTIYKLPGVEMSVVRSTWGPSRHDLLTKPQYALTRLTLAESGGRGKAVSGPMKAFQPLKPLADFDTAGQLQRLLRAIKKAIRKVNWAKGPCASRVSRSCSKASGSPRQCPSMRWCGAKCGLS